MSLEINPQVVRALWFNFLPILAWIFAFLLVIFAGKRDKRKLLKVLLWISPAFFLWTALVAFYVVMLSNSHI